MSRAAYIFLCIQVYLIQQSLAAPACLQLGSNYIPSNQLSGLTLGNLQPNNIIIEPCEIITENLQCGDVSVTGDLPIGGTIRVSGCFPVYGVVAVDGAVPSQGTGIVNHSCACSR
ncbi:uncharacterized protein [Choristoneura fumiferana]|uniref:uncharacterized protein n=1 Tax=Choristoneura fumiferana TaxID=7141 RepID=UPI003D15458B